MKPKEASSAVDDPSVLLLHLTGALLMPIHTCNVLAADSFRMRLNGSLPVVAAVVLIQYLYCTEKQHCSRSVGSLAFVNSFSQTIVSALFPDMDKPLADFSPMAASTAKPATLLRLI